MELERISEKALETMRKLFRNKRSLKKMGEAAQIQKKLFQNEISLRRTGRSMDKLRGVYRKIG